MAASHAGQVRSGIETVNVLDLCTPLSVHDLPTYSDFVALWAVFKALEPTSSGESQGYCSSDAGRLDEGWNSHKTSFRRWEDLVVDPTAAKTVKWATVKTVKRAIEKVVRSYGQVCADALHRIPHHLLTCRSWH